MSEILLVFIPLMRLLVISGITLSLAIFVEILSKLLWKPLINLSKLIDFCIVGLIVFIFCVVLIALGASLVELVLLDWVQFAIYLLFVLTVSILNSVIILIATFRSTFD